MSRTLETLTAHSDDGDLISVHVGKYNELVVTNVGGTDAHLIRQIFACRCQSDTRDVSNGHGLGASCIERDHADHFFQLFFQKNNEQKKINSDECDPLRLIRYRHRHLLNDFEYQEKICLEKRRRMDPQQQLSEQAFRRRVDAQLQSAIDKEKSAVSELPKGILEDLLVAMNTAAADAHAMREALPEMMSEMIRKVGEEASGALDQALKQLGDYKLLEEKSLSAQEELKNFFLQCLAKLLVTPALERLDALNAQETYDVAVRDVTGIDQQTDEVFMTEAEAEPPEENPMKSLVTYCLSNNAPPQFGRAYLETQKTLQHLCTHAFVAFWEAHFAMHVLPKGFHYINIQEIATSGEGKRRSWLVNQYIRDSPKPLEVILRQGGPLPPSVLDASVLDKVSTINALTLERNSLREIQNAPVANSPGVLFRIVIVMDRGQGLFAGGYYEFKPDAFRDKDSQHGRINVECTQDEQLRAAYANNVNMKKWYVPIITDIGHVVVPASILSRAFEQFTHRNGKPYKFVDANKNRWDDMHSALEDTERQVFVYVSGERNVYMSNLDLVFVAGDTNIFMNECDYEYGGNHCSSKVALYDEVSYCFTDDFFAKKQEVSRLNNKKRKRRANTAPKMRGTQELQNLAARACNFYHTSEI